MTRLAELRKRLLTEVSSLLQPYGVESKLAEQSFRIAKPFGWASIHLAYVNHPPTDFDVIVNAAIRVNGVQEAIQEHQVLITAKDGKRAATIGVELGNLKGTGQHRWTVASERDLSPVAAGIVAACEEWLFPFIDKYSDLEVLLETLTTNAKAAALISPFDDKRKATIVALSSLLRRP